MKNLPGVSADPISDKNEPASSDVEEPYFGSTLSFPNKLYGRDQELTILHAAYRKLLDSTSQSTEENEAGWKPSSGDASIADPNGENHRMDVRLSTFRTHVWRILSL